jgi:methionine sulfoxide reductase catalytic subunit
MKFDKNPAYQDLADEVTPEQLFLDRRSLMAATGAIGAGLAFTGAAAAQAPNQKPPAGKAAQPAAASARGASHPEPGAALKTRKSAFTVADESTVEEAFTGYCNYYEFGTDKSDPARYASMMTVSPWTIEVSGETGAPGKYTIEDLVDYSKLEERIYRHRCVEAWSMVVPWVGVPMASVIDRLKPGPKARYVQFQTYLNRKEMPGTRFPSLDWPYVEGLRLDEARNELTLMAVGAYGKALAKQNGAPLRTVIPWKYGFKATKSVVAIRFTEKEPATAWNKAAANEYGFYSNVNPAVDHPRWSQASERVIGGKGFNPRRKTEMFNGYEKQVAQLYKGMDLKRNY